MSKDILDTRDLAERRNELKDMIFESFIESFPEYKDGTDTFDDILRDREEIEDWMDTFFEDELNEIEEINTIEAECSEFPYGETLIADSEFDDYCKDLCEDLGYISKDFPSFIEIDWDATANNIRQDYTEAEYQGTTYLFRV
jgi:hypothetical protein